MPLQKIPEITSSWTLFLDRDGVINKKLENDYVKHIGEFEFLPEVPEALASLKNEFNRIIVVTNQQGIGKKLMTEGDLRKVHDHMLAEVEKAGGKIDRIYHAPQLAKENSVFRKPGTGMPEQAKKDFPEIDFQQSVLIGDSLSDMQLGRKLGMFTVYIHPQEQITKEVMPYADTVFQSLKAFADRIVRRDN